MVRANKGHSRPNSENFLPFSFVFVYANMASVCEQIWNTHLVVWKLLDFVAFVF